MGYYETLARQFQRRSMRFGIPFFIFVVCGSFGLREFSELRFKYGSKKTLIHEAADVVGFEMKKPGEVTLESEYDKIKNMDTENWENKRIPRPWE